MIILEIEGIEKVKLPQQTFCIWAIGEDLIQDNCREEQEVHRGCG